MRLRPKRDAGGGGKVGAGQITPDLARAGFMTREERKKFENLNSSYNKYWVPCVWFCNLAAQARREGRIRGEQSRVLSPNGRGGWTPLRPLREI